MDILFGDHINVICSFLTPSSIYSLKRSSTIFSFVKISFNKQEIKQDIIKHDKLSLLQYLIDINLLTVKDFLFAIESGCLNLVKILIEKSPNTKINLYIESSKHYSTTNIMESATKSNLLVLLGYLYNYGFKTGDECVGLAIKNKNLEILKFLIRKKTFVSFDNAIEAAATDNLEILKLLLNNIASIPLNNEIIRSSCKHGSINILKWFKTKGVDFNDIGVLYNAVESGSLETLEWLLQMNITHDYQKLLEHSIYQEKFNISEWLINTHNCFIPNNIVSEINRRCNNPQNKIKWLTDNRYNFTE